MPLEATALGYLRALDQTWNDWFKKVAGLDLASATLAQDLLAERAIDRQQPGVGDFDPGSRAAIVPGDPASSLLYHALASPLVKPAGASPNSYPTVADLDLIENYILSLQPFSPAAITANVVIA